MRLCRGCHEHLPATDGCLRAACGMPCSRLETVVATVQGFPPLQPPAAKEVGLRSPSQDQPREGPPSTMDPPAEFAEGAWEVPCVYSAAEGGRPEGAKPQVVGEVGDRAKGVAAKAWARCLCAARKVGCVLRQAIVRHLL